MQNYSDTIASKRGDPGCLRRLVVRWIACTIAMWLSILIVNAFAGWFDQMGWVSEERFKIELTSFLGPVLFVAVLSIANAVLRPLVTVLSCPLSCFFFGMAGLVSMLIHALIFYFIGKRVPGVSIPSFLSAFLASIVYSVLSGAIIWVTREPRSRR